MQIDEKEWLSSVLACPYCLTPDILKHLKKDDEITFYQCDHCNRIYPVDKFGIIDFQVVDKLVSLPEPYWGMWALAQHGSLEDYSERNPGSVATPERDVVKTFSNFMDLEDKTVLDVGSGTDYVPGYIQNHSLKHYIALDPLPVEQDIPYSKIQAWAELLPFNNDSFDVVILGTSLDHIVCLDSFLSDLNRILRNNGCIYIWSAFFTDQSWYKNITPYKLFKRDFEDKLPKGKSLEKFIKDTQELKNRFDNVKTLKEKYEQYLVDKWHFRHIPINTFRKIRSFGFDIYDFRLWELNFHENNIFMNIFMKLEKVNTLADDKNAVTKQHLDILTILTNLMQDTYNIKQMNIPLEQEIASLKQDIGVVKQDIGVVKQDIGTVKQDIDAVKQDIDAVKQEIGYIQQQIRNLPLYRKVRKLLRI